MVRVEEVKSGWPEAPEDGRRRVVFSNLEAATESELEFTDSDIRRVWQQAQDRGVNEPSEDPESSGLALPLPGVGTAGWSYATDGRVAKPISPLWPVNSSYLMRIGQVDRDCTGTLVGRRLVLTAAHCVVRPDLAFVSKSFRARASGAAAPYGVETSSAYWWDSQYVANGCHTQYYTANENKCGPWDWALILLRENAWSGSPSGTPGYMGFVAPTAAVMTANNYARNDGYPGCNIPSVTDEPVGCVPNVAYGDLEPASARDFRYPDPGDGNFNLLYDTSTDFSPGHSGGPVWTPNYVFPHWNGPYVLGIAILDHCNGTTCASYGFPDYSHPLIVRSMSPWLGGFISSQRVSYP